MYNAFENYYGIFLNELEGIAFFDTISIHEFIKYTKQTIPNLYKLETFAIECDQIKQNNTK